MLNYLFIMPWQIYRSKEPIVEYKYRILSPARLPGSSSLVEDYCKTAEQKGILHKIDYVTKELEKFGYSELQGSDPFRSCINLINYFLEGKVPEVRAYNYQYQYYEEEEEVDVAEKVKEVREYLKDILQDLGDYLEANHVRISVHWNVLEPPAYHILTEDGDVLEARCDFLNNDTPTVYIKESSGWHPYGKDSIVVKRDSVEAVDYLFKECTEYCYGRKMGIMGLKPRDFIEKLIKELE